MTATARLIEERHFHDRQAAERRLTFERFPAALQVDDDAYLDHESWARPAFAKLGELRGRRVLDYGCGHGMMAVVMARRGAHVWAFDLSGGYAGEAARRAQANGVRVDVVQADGARLPFADASFDAVWGNAVLHHLDVADAGREIARVLRPGGVAVFCEPWGDNPLLRWARRRLPYRGKHRTTDEEPLRSRQIAILRNYFASVEVEGHQFLAMTGRAFGSPRLAAALHRCDRRLLRWFPALGRFCRYVVLTLRVASLP